jgi:hypothetical protein
MILFQQPALIEQLARRRLLCNSVQDFHSAALNNAYYRSQRDWQVHLGDSLIFDAAGLKAIANAIQNYSGNATRLQFRLKLSAEALRDYYSHSVFLQDSRVSLPITAEQDGNTETTETLDIELTELSTQIHFPLSLTRPDTSRIPFALLMPYSCDHDLLFSNQIAIISNIAAKVRYAPWSWLTALLSRQGGLLRQRIPLHWNKIHSSARIHPSAVIEGSVIGEDCRIGAHCVVRYSVLGKQVQLHDGAKVEYSAIDDNTWLMHDLVLYRSLVESHVFLIHGPYQFSYFQQQSAAFATIMMDYRPDERDIQINTPNGVRAYKGRFLGALLEERSKVLGGTLIAPGITIPHDRQVYAKAEDVIKAKDLPV